MIRTQQTMTTLQFSDTEVFRMICAHNPEIPEDALLRFKPVTSTGDIFVEVMFTADQGTGEPPVNPAEHLTAPAAAPATRRPSHARVAAATSRMERSVNRAEYVHLLRAITRRGGNGVSIAALHDEVSVDPASRATRLFSRTSVAKHCCQLADYALLERVKTGTYSVTELGAAVLALTDATPDTAPR